MKKLFFLLVSIGILFANSVDKIEEWKNKVIQEDPRIPGIGVYGNKIFFFQSMTTTVPVTSKNFADALNNAYQKAYLEILQDYAIRAYGKNLVEQSRELFSDESDNAEQIQNTNTNIGNGFAAKIKTLFNKLLMLGDKKLDKALIKLGVSEEEIAKLNPVQKKELFKDKFLQKVVEKTIGSVRGIFVIRSKWVLDNDGYATVGIIAKRTPITVQIADMIAKKRPINLKLKSDIDYYLNGTNKELISRLGTRVAFDKNGEPALVSYGISGYQKVSNRYRNDTLRNLAYKRAIAQANAQIALFSNGFLSSTFKTITGEVVENYVQKQINSDEVPQFKDIQNIIKKTFQTIKAKASLDLRGSYVAKQYSYNLKINDKTSLPLIGAIVVWKYSAYETMKNMDKKPALTIKHSKSPINSQEFEESTPPVINDF